jgi:hypothetical protein
MKLKGLIISIACLSCSLAVFGQKSISTAEYDFFINDTLRIDPSQIKYVDTLSTAVRRMLTPKPKTDGFTVYYAVDGRKFSEGLLKNKQKEGLWYSYFDSGVMASKINYSNNKREGTCWFYYKTAQLNATGQFINDLKEGEWTYYLKDGTLQGVYKYKAGEIIEKH